MKRTLLATVIASAFALSAPGVFAETANTTANTDVALEASQGATEAQSPQRQAQRERKFRMPSERIEARLAYLKTALKITAAQEGQWNSFATVLRNHARDMDKRIQDRRAQGAQQPRERANVDGLARLERMQSRMQQRAARLGEVINAAKPLYASFTPEQKQVADELISRGGRHGRGHGGHRHHRMHRPA